MSELMRYYVQAYRLENYITQKSPERARYVVRITAGEKHTYVVQVYVLTDKHDGQSDAD